MFVLSASAWHYHSNINPTAKKKKSKMVVKRWQAKDMETAIIHRQRNG